MLTAADPLYRDDPSAWARIYATVADARTQKGTHTVEIGGKDYFLAVIE